MFGNELAISWKQYFHGQTRTVVSVYPTKALSLELYYSENEVS